MKSIIKIMLTVIITTQTNLYVKMKIKSNNLEKMIILTNMLFGTNKNN